MGVLISLKSRYYPFPQFSTLFAYLSIHIPYHTQKSLRNEKETRKPPTDSLTHSFNSPTPTPPSIKTHKQKIHQYFDFYPSILFMTHTSISTYQTTPSLPPSLPTHSLSFTEYIIEFTSSLISKVIILHFILSSYLLPLHVEFALL